MVKLSYQQASDLGTTFATGVRDIIRYTTDEANRAMNAGLPLIRFLHPSKVRGFKATWAALLEATAVWVVCQECPEYRTNDKFVKKTLFQLDSTLEMLLPNVFKELSPEQLEHYEQARKKLIFLAMQPDAVKSDLSERFLVLLHGEGSKRITDKTQLTTLKQVTMSASVFQSLFEIELGINKKKDEKLNQKIAG